MNILTLKVFSIVALLLGIVGLFYLFLILGEMNTRPTLFVPSAVSFLGGSSVLTYLAFFKK